MCPSPGGSAPLEARQTSPRPRIRPDIGGLELVNAFAAFIFAASGPVAIILAVGLRGGLSPADLSSWLFGGFTLNGLLSIGFCWWYRQPLVFLWTILGAVLVGPALGHVGFGEILGASLVTGALMAALGLSGWVRRGMDAVPMPVVMGMVAGVFLRFGLDLVRAVRDEVWIAGPMAAAFLALTARPGLLRAVPPVIGAMAVGIVAVLALGRFDPGGAVAVGLAHPNLYLPVLSWPALLELVAPLAVSVLVVQNAQGIAVLRAAGHEPPVTAITVACGLASMVTALVGSVPTCLTGPVNAIISGSGDRRRHYGAGIVVGILAVAFGLLSPALTRLVLAMPRAFVDALAGLAMLRVLQTAFAIAFGGRFALGALACFLVTVADLPIARVGAPFWGLVLGFAVSRVVERAEETET